MKKTFAFLCCLIMLFSKSMHAEDLKPGLSFYYRQLDNRSGLSNSSVNALLQDKEQLLWVGTWDGLNRYDGSQFKVYNHNIDQKENSIGSNVIQSLNEDNKGNIWISTIGGISRYHKNSGKFYRYFYRGNTSKKVSENEFELAINERGEVYCYAASGLLTKYDAKKDQFTEYQRFGSGKGIVKLLFLNELLWCLNQQGMLAAYRVSPTKLVPVEQIATPKVVNFFIVNQKLIYSTANNIHYAVSQQFKLEETAILHKKIKAIAFYENNYVVAWENQGVDIYQANFTKGNILRSEVKRLENIKITSLKVSQEKALWLGTDGNGLIQLYPKNNYFGLVTKLNGPTINKPIRAFSEVDGNLWVGTKGNGVLVFNNFWGGNQSVSKKIDVSAGLENNAVFAIRRGIDQLMYIGTDGEGISVYDLQANKIVNWKSIKGTQELPYFKSVYSVVQDQDSSVWIGTSGYGIVHLKIGKGANGALEIKNFRQYLSRALEHQGPANDIIYAIAKGKDNRIWIGCRYGGLSVFDPKTRMFKTFKALGYEGSLSHSDVLSLFYDSKDRLWIGTSYGLNSLSRSESVKNRPHFTNITTSNGLPNNTIHGIQEDAAGNIWLSTNKGLAKLSPGTNSIANYQESDGLQSNEFSDGAVFKTANQDLLFGGIYGFNFFVPKNITENTKQPNLLISDLQLGGKEFFNNQYLIFKAGQATFPTYELERKNNFFQFSVNALNFYNASKNEFAYKLKGLDRNWRLTGADGKISYYNIPPGSYDLLVHWSNGEGIWTNDVTALRINVKQYFWLTYPAYAFYLFLVLASGYGFHRYRKNKLEMKFQLEHETLFRQKDEDVHRQRINFFTNIAHEIQTPLTLILGSVEHFMRKHEFRELKMDENYFLTLVHQHTARLTYLVQQLLEFRRAEAGYLQRNDNYLDISKLLTQLTLLFIPAAEKNNQQFKRNIQEGIAGFIDKDKYEKILFNLLSNAFKYTPLNEQIAFTVSYDPTTRVMRTIVANAGCKLKQEDLQYLFKEFHVGHESHFEKFSTGIGLAFTRQLINILDGTIDVYLKDEWIFFEFSLTLGLMDRDRKEEVITSAPSYLFESILKPYNEEVTETIEDRNKSTLIEELKDKATYSVLIVEDDVALRFLLKNILKDYYNVYEADQGNAAIAFLNHQTPDIIISDIMMPDMDGLTLCRLVKTAPATSHIPFIMLSARGSEDQKTEGYEIGADAYIPKPFHINYLLVRIRKLLDYRNRMNNLIKDGNISNHFVDVDLEHGDKEFLNALIKTVEDNLAEPNLDSSTLEQALCISKMQLYRKLKSLAGMTPSEFIKRIRLKHAAVMLRNTKLTVAEIFYRTGFNNKSYFFREFKKIYHLAPNDYRLKQNVGHPTETSLN